jgi:L-methionine (R)-S-oxide reductase
MAENIFIDTSDKSSAYAELLKIYGAIIDGETNETARLSTLVCLLKSTFGERFFWTGFYMVDSLKPNELVVGTYQGTMGCLRIPFAKGVCGKCAREQKTQIIDDVHAIEDHIACDSRSNSEIVIPVFEKKQKLCAVLDIDSTQYGAFDEIDAQGLEALCNIIYK